MSASPKKLNKKTLVVTWSLPPGLVGSSNIMSSLARGFTADEMALVGERWPGPDDNHWDDENETKPSIHFIHSQWPRKFKKTIRLFLFPFVLWRLYRVFKKTNSEQILAVFPNEYYSFLALIVAKFCKVPFFSYFHNTYLDNRTGIKRLFARWLQPKIFRNSKAIFVMSDGMKDVMEKEYPNQNFVALVHSFHGPIPKSQHKSATNNNIRMAFMGNLNSSNQDAFERVKILLEEFPGCELTTYSGTDDIHFHNAGVNGPRVKHTRVAFDEVVEALKKHDILFLPHGFEGGFKDIEYETIFPTRTIPYLLAGVPIFAHSPPNAFLTKWLKNHDCAEVVDTKTKESLITCFTELMKSPDRQQEIVANALIAASNFQISNVSSVLRSVMNQQKTEL